MCYTIPNKLLVHVQSASAWMPIEFVLSLYLLQEKPVCNPVGLILGYPVGPTGPNQSTCTCPSPTTKVPWSQTGVVDVKLPILLKQYKARGGQLLDPMQNTSALKHIINASVVTIMETPLTIFLHGGVGKTHF